jgi:hypothetical protein
MCYIKRTQIRVILREQKYDFAIYFSTPDIVVNIRHAYVTSAPLVRCLKRWGSDGGNSGSLKYTRCVCVFYFQWTLQR